MCNNSAEELGLVLGHEISHIICNHTRSRSGLSATLTGLELVALSMLDPSVSRDGCRRIQIILTLVYDVW